MVEQASADRLPMPESLNPEQRRAVERITSGLRGGLFGPFVPLLRAPELMTRVQLVGEYLRFESELPDHLRELLILLVARDWDQDFEWGHHVPLARASGLGEDVIATIAAGGAPVGPHDVRAFWRLAAELVRGHAVGDATFADAVAAAGEVAVVEAIVTIGYYTTLAMTMNAARTPIPDDYERLP
ncbi:carboxymuconolactone decarboxylase family protein [Mycolicibacterium smegmatis]|uniref:carboxymuconolactone decarboxylase family protein n=1 Tax=Mycolicibacterium smegmatis TaxID=1772 RepID=UPI001E5A02FC|nr:carboxymuconolactone decarboxylase family protein [Mycolicibacterium smegmatis]UGU33508.1 carboxymuconolactone decarboxylase family protein [Mycolicibacterium smegmatis]ULN68372.1 carboxymuconolactone decarboxylase family protein [Mycolicibacterium smegmatis]